MSVLFKDIGFRWRVIRRCLRMIWQHVFWTGDYPCWTCGQVHRGDYAIYDFGHHNCQHKGHYLRRMDFPDIKKGEESEQVMCLGCGDLLEVEPLKDADFFGAVNPWKEANHG